MLKPLLRTLPTLSGNVKIACDLTDYINVDNKNFESFVKYARLLPLTSSLAQHPCEISLIDSSYEFDLKKFYGKYSNYFFTDCFDFNKVDYEKLDKYNTQNSRNVDFEYGVKRVSYVKNGVQFAFYAPIYIESIEDIPDYFLINIDIKNEYYQGTKTVKVNIKNQSNAVNNYLYKYISKYASKIDSNVIYCLPNTNQASYYGINLQTGGFVKKVDNIFGKNYVKQSTINNFDAIISNGWKRNEICMKQILPLCFYFNINDFLSDADKIKFTNSECSISGAYYKDNKIVAFYDIDTDYNVFYESVLKMNKNNGIIDFVNTNVNILDVKYPSLNETQFIGYRYSNKVNKLYNRWKLKYSSDEHPYITNMSWGFSYNQNSNYKYGEFPETFSSINIISDYNNNLIFPIGNAITSDKSPYFGNYNLINNYNIIMNNYASTWFNLTDGIDVYEKVFVNNIVDIKDEPYFYFDETLQTYIQYTNEEIEDIKRRLQLPKRNKEHISHIVIYRHNSIWDDTTWITVEDNKAFCNGILYDLSNIYNTLPESKHVDKFNVYVRVNFNPISVDKLSSIKSAKYTIFNNSEYMSHRNCFVSSTVMKSFSAGTFNESVNSFYINETTSLVKNEVADNKLFIEETDPNKDGQFIDLINYDYNFYDVNKYYKMSDIKRVFNDSSEFIYNIEDLFNHTLNINDYYINSYELLPIYQLSEIYNDNGVNFIELEKNNNAEWLTEKLYFSNGVNQYKNQYDKRVINNLYNSYGNVKNAIPLYIKDTFVTYTTLRTVLYENLTNDIADNIAMPLISYLTEYEFRPIVKDNDEICSTNVFTRRDTFSGRKYGDMIPTNEIISDHDVIYLDQYNMNNVIANYNQRFGTSIPLYGIDEELNDVNSAELNAKLLNEAHLRYYINTIYNNYDLTSNPLTALYSLYIKKRLIINDYNIQTLYIKDLYLSLSDFYIIDIYKLLTDPAYNQTYADFVNEQLSEETISKIIDFNKSLQVSISDLYNDIDMLVNKLIDNEEFRNNYTQQIFTITSSDLLNDLIYNEAGYWEFSDDFNKTHNIDGLANITDLDDNETSTFKFELVYRKRFIKVNDNLFKLINVNESSSNPYKDLYLFTLCGSTEYSKELKYYYTDDVSLVNTTSELTECLKPLFDDVLLQNKKETAVYKEYNQNRITPTTYMYAPQQFGHYYRYNVDNTVVMFDISTYPNDAYPIIGHDIYTNDEYYYYPKSYINSYQAKTGINILDVDTNKMLISYNMIDNCNSYLSQPNTYSSVKESYIAYSYTDFNNPQRGYNVSYTYYAPEIWERKTNKVNPFKNYGYVSDIENIYYGSYVSWDVVPYTYYPEYTEYGDRFTYEYKIYDDIGAFEKYKLNSYTVSNTYTYSYLTNVETTYKVESPTGEFLSYDITYYVPTYVTGYATSYTTYGFFFIDVNLDNTYSSINVVDSNYKPKKYFSYINDRYIYSEDFNIDSSFEYLVPFTKLNLLQSLYKDNICVSKPSVCKQDIYYKQVPLSDEAGTQYAYDITLSTKQLGSISLERYFDSIVPYIKKASTIKNTYNLKYKDIDASMNISYTNDVMFNTDMNIYKYVPLRVYDIDNNYTTFYPVEYKYFNDNVVINLEESFDIHISDKLTDSELDELKNEEHIIAALKKYLNFGKNHSYTDDEILFLYNRYNVICESVCVGLNITKTGKLYSLTYKFTLL